MYNTVTVILNAVIIILAILVLGLFIKGWRKADTKAERRIIVFGIFIYIFIIAMLVLTTLNYYGVARVPVFNEVTRKLPDTYVAPELDAPPTQGPVQPSTKPTFDEHRERMEKLKKDGF